MIHIVQYLLLVFIAFVPVWAGGQSMKCYNQGHHMRALAGVFLATVLNAVIIIGLVMYYRYNVNVVTIVMFFKSLL